MPTETTPAIDWEHVAKHGLAKCTPEHTWAEWVADRNAEIERLRAELEKVRKCILHYDHFLIDLTKDFIGNFDGADLQDLLVANGLYVIEAFDPEKHYDWSGAAETGDDFYTPSEIVLAARAMLAASPVPQNGESE